MSVRELSGFARRHIGPSASDLASMLKLIGAESLDKFVSTALPQQIQLSREFELSAFSEPLSESDAIDKLRQYFSQNKVATNFIGLGYYDCIVPPVIQRNILENPGWYTQYTPYQPEISQGRLEALLNFQTMVSDLTALPVSNASMLDEGTAAAEAMSMSRAIVAKKKKDANTFLVSTNCHPQTIAVVETRAAGLGIDLKVVHHSEFQFSEDVFGALVQYPGTEGEVEDLSSISEAAHRADAMITVATDLLALCLLKAPGELGADIAVGNSQRFGVPFGFGGPHAAFFATKDEHKRLMPGRIVGVSVDASGKPALRLALQTREQHIRRERATSNICTAQVLLAIMAGMYGVYHGPEGLKEIAADVASKANSLAASLKNSGFSVVHQNFFDTICIETEGSSEKVCANLRNKGINIRKISDSRVSISVDETTSVVQLNELFSALTGSTSEINLSDESSIPQTLKRSSAYLEHQVFNSYHSETEFLRYLSRLESRDLSLRVSMIPLGSCTMKLNATSEMLPVTWPEVGAIHPFASVEQAKGYQLLFSDLESALAEITGFSAVSLQPNAGSQGEYAGLMVIRGYHHANGDNNRDICLIPKSAHGTNPASAIIAGMKVVVVACDSDGNIDLEDLKAKAEKHAANLSALMVTYPSTHGVFEESIGEICSVVHQYGGQVYLDGANLNAMVGLSKPAEFGADVCHFNLHKTFCIPHGGGGPGMGPIGVAQHLAPFLPGHPLVELGHSKNIGPVSAAPWGSSSILPISWMYMAMMGAEGLKLASQVAILNANYIAKRLEEHYPVLYRGLNGLVAHECIIDLRELKKSAGVEVEDVAKRLMDYGFHAPTISWPVPGTMMIEPTESESLKELDSFCEAMISIRREIAEVESGKVDRESNLLKNAPHTAEVVTADSWGYPYSRELAAFPVQRLREYKFWPATSRIDSAYGDKNFVCTCPGVEEYE